MACKVDTWLVRLGGTGKRHCRAKWFSLLGIGSKKGKMLKWWCLRLLLELGVQRLSTEQLPSQLLDCGRIFIPLRGGTARGQPPQLHYLSGSLVDCDEV